MKIKFSKFLWEEGRNKGGYRKMMLLESDPPRFDCWLLHYPPGALAGKNRLNIVLRQPAAGNGGEFKCSGPYRSWLGGRIIRFCPSECEHEVTPVSLSCGEATGGEERLVLSIGWLTGEIFG